MKKLLSACLIGAALSISVHAGEIPMVPAPVTRDPITAVPNSGAVELQHPAEATDEDTSTLTGEFDLTTLILNLLWF